VLEDVAARLQEVLRRRVRPARRVVSRRPERQAQQAVWQPERQARPEEQAACVRIRPQ